MCARLYTIGYAGHSPDEFRAKLLAAGVQLLVDVRRLPLSRKRGFSKTALAEHLAAAVIEYRHLPALGVEREMRHQFKAGLPIVTPIEEVNSRSRSGGWKIDLAP